MEVSRKEMELKSLILVVLVIGVVLVGACDTADTTPGPDATPGPGATDLEEINGSGNIIEREIDVQNFNKVEVSGEGVLIIEQGDEESLVIETDDNILEYIEVSVSEHTLKIENVVDEGFDLVPTEAIYYYLKLENIEELTLPGVVKVICDSLQVNRLNLDMSGVTDVELSGEIDSLNISVDGVGDLKGRNLLSAECSISGAGTADITISVSEILDINFQGIGSIRYIGNPEINEDVGLLVEVEKFD